MDSPNHLATVLRRRGVAQALVAACEAVALAAGFPDLYIQAATTARDPTSPLGGWLSQARFTVPLTAFLA